MPRTHQRRSQGSNGGSPWIGVQPAHVSYNNPQNQWQGTLEWVSCGADCEECRAGSFSRCCHWWDCLQMVWRTCNVLKCCACPHCCKPDIAAAWFLGGLSSCHSGDQKSKMLQLSSPQGCHDPTEESQESQESQKAQVTNICWWCFEEQQWHSDDCCFSASMCHRVPRSSSGCLAGSSCACATFSVDVDVVVIGISTLLPDNRLAGKIILHLSESARARRSCVRDDLRDDLVCERRMQTSR